MTFFYKDQRLAGMGQTEAGLFTKFIDAHGSEYFGFKYNFKLLRPINLPTDFPKEYISVAQNNTAFRIDCVLQDQQKTTIVEVRPDAKQNAVGQLIMYKFLYQLQENPSKTVVMMLITNTFDPGLEFTCRQINIKYIVY